MLSILCQREVTGKMSNNQEDTICIYFTGNEHFDTLTKIDSDVISDAEKYKVTFFKVGYDHNEKVFSLSGKFDNKDIRTRYYKHIHRLIGYILFMGEDSMNIDDNDGYEYDETTSGSLVAIYTTLNKISSEGSDNELQYFGIDKDLYDGIYKTYFMWSILDITIGKRELDFNEKIERIAEDFKNFFDIE